MLIKAQNSPQGCIQHWGCAKQVYICRVHCHAGTREQLEPRDNRTWLPPAAWVSGVLGGLQQSVDVDSVGPYTQLLQECVVLQPGLLCIPPNEAAATCCQLERHTRSSAVWFGPAVVATMLQQHSPSSLQQQLSDLLHCWLTQGAPITSPHSFGALWLHAPAALLQTDVTAFELRLRQLGQLVPEIPPCELLSSSSVLAGFLLSLPDLQQLQGHVHRQVPGVLLFSHPCLQDVRVVQQQGEKGQQGQQQQQGEQLEQGQQQQREQPGLVSISVYGVVSPEQQQLPSNLALLGDPSSNSGSSPPVAAAGVPAAAAPAAADAAASTARIEAPWQQQPEQRYTTGVYEYRQHTQPDRAANNSSGGRSRSSSSTGGSSRGSSSKSLQAQLLAEFTVWRQGPCALPTPLLVLPPQPQQQQQ